MEIKFELKNKHLVIAAGALVVVALAVFLYPHFKLQLTKQSTQTASGKIIDVSVTAQGFQPNQVEINAGDTVRWTNNSQTARWPASNPHPTHDDYPGFDPLKEVGPGQTWQFTFFREGSWGYHDHLYPHDHGTVVVKAATTASVPNGQLPPEIDQLKSETDTKKQAEIVRGMAEKYGPKETLGFMRASGLPYTGETHLLVHEIGDVAYKKYGEQALLYCDDSFLSACYHGVVLHELADHGLEGVAKTIDQCKSQGSAVLSQCSHAAGHGFLAWKEYQVLQAVPYCDKLHEIDKDIPLFNCQDGVFMENIFGVHEGSPSPNRLVIKQSDPQYPCDAMPDQYQSGCWANQATFMYQLYGELRKVAVGCDQVTNIKYQDLCYNNFARQIHPLTQGQSQKAIELCKNATTPARQDDCLITIANAAFSVGDVKQMPYELCATLVNSPKHSKCYEDIFNAMAYYTHAGPGELCQYVKEPDQQKICKQRF